MPEAGLALGGAPAPTAAVPDFEVEAGGLDAGEAETGAGGFDAEPGGGGLTVGTDGLAEAAACSG